MATEDKGVESKLEDRKRVDKLVELDELASKCQDAEAPSATKRIEDSESCALVGTPASCPVGHVALSLDPETVVTIRKEDVIDVRAVDGEEDQYRVRVKKGVSGVFASTRVMPICSDRVGSSNPFGPFLYDGEDNSPGSDISHRKMNCIYKFKVVVEDGEMRIVRDDDCFYGGVYGGGGGSTGATTGTVVSVSDDTDEDPLGPPLTDGVSCVVVGWEEKAVPRRRTKVHIPTYVRPKYLCQEVVHGRRIRTWTEWGEWKLAFYYPDYPGHPGMLS